MNIVWRYPCCDIKPLASDMGRMKTWIKLWLFALALLAMCALAQETVKVLVANNIVLVPVRINGQGLLFVLDTGSDGSAIDAALVTPLGLKNVGDVQILRNYRTPETSAVEVESLGIGNHIFEGPLLTVVSTEAPSRALGTKVDGILGNDVLGQLSFKLNYSEQDLVLAPLPQPGNLAAPVQLRRSGNQFFVPVQAMSLPIELLLDTGTNSTNLSWGTWQQLSQQWTPPSIVDGIVRAGAPTPPAFLICLPNVSVGGLTNADQVLRVQRPVESGAFSTAQFDGILGSDLLSEFEITFDLKHNRIFFQKDVHFRADPFRYTTIGIQFARNNKNEYSVMSVWKNSPADKAGVVIGDQIKAINGEAAAPMTSEQVSGRLHGAEGTGVNLSVERDGKPATLALRTRQLLCVTGQQRRATYWISTVLTARFWSSKEFFDPAYQTQIGPRFTDHPRSRLVKTGSLVSGRASEKRWR